MCFEGYLPRFSRKSVPDVRIQYVPFCDRFFVTAFWGTSKKKALANFFVSA